MAIGREAGEARDPRRIADLVQAEWRAAGPYLDTASYGLPPDSGWRVLQAALADWRAGTGRWEDWGERTEGSRAAFARLVGVPAERVAVGSTVSELIGLIAAAIPAPARVVAPDVEFTSALFPWMVHADRGVAVETVPTARLAEAIDARTTVVCFSAVQSSSGEVADIDAVVAAAAHHGALTVVDATQAAGWLPLEAGRFDALACGAYKWLMSPRGTAFMTLGDALAERVRPLAAGWYAGEDPHASYYGPPLRLARSARRFDVSPAWFSWVGTQPALELLERIGVGQVHAHDLALANRFRAGLGLPPGDSAIVSAEVGPAAERLAGAGIRTAVRAGRVRAAFHLYNSERDVDAALDVLAG